MVFRHPTLASFIFFFRPRLFNKAFFPFTKSGSMPTHLDSLSIYHVPEHGGSTSRSVFCTQRCCWHGYALFFAQKFMAFHLFCVIMSFRTGDGQAFWIVFSRDGWKELRLSQDVDSIAIWVA
jgi:hypothetical protein